MAEPQKRFRGARFIIVILPNLSYFVVLLICILLVPVMGLPWQLLPGVDVTYMWRFVELLIGQILLILAITFITWGIISLGIKRAEGGEIGKTESILVTRGAYAYCRHPVTLGFVFATPAFGLTFDFVPLLLQTLLYTPILLGLLFYEERELLSRFGEPYQIYQQTVPFIIPQRKRGD